MPATRVDTVRLIVADDLTGAADACVKLVARGASGLVLPNLEAASRDGSDDRPLLDRAQIIAISTDTRRRSASAAAARVRQAAALAGRSSDGGVFAKIDSTLRGHVGVEIATVLAAFDCTHALVAPSFPAMGRRVIAGQLIVDGPGAPPPRDVVALLTAQGLSQAVCVSGSDPEWSPTPSSLRRAIDDAIASGVRVLVFDAAADADLQMIVAAGHAAGGRPLWVGSAGLADALGNSADMSDRPRAPLPQPTRGVRPGPALLCIGSMHPVTREQQARVLAERTVRLFHPAAMETLETLTIDTFAGLVLSGGDTATDVCGALGVTAIELVGEVAPGVPWGILRGGRAAGLPVVLKSGGFGHAATLVDVVDFLSNGCRARDSR